MLRVCFAQRQTHRPDFSKVLRFGQRELAIVAFAALLQQRQLIMILRDRAAQLVFRRSELALQILARLIDLFLSADDLLLVFRETAFYSLPSRIVRGPARSFSGTRAKARRRRRRSLLFDGLLIDLLRQLLDLILELADRTGQRLLAGDQIASLVVLPHSVSDCAQGDQACCNKWHTLFNPERLHSSSSVASRVPFRKQLVVHHINVGENGHPAVKVWTGRLRLRPWRRNPEPRSSRQCSF